uniref:Uncharacterized protein n=1 Tax=Timema cristinae TaxID=61476 RepID=A0A7R9CEE6_TIMCR|nr:unnamed protein product [Timema cristinae]
MYEYLDSLSSSGSGTSLTEFQFLAASRRAAAAVVLPPGSAGGGVGVPPPPHHPPDFHPAYRLSPYMEHLYSSLQQHSSPAASSLHVSVNKVDSTTVNITIIHATTQQIRDLNTPVAMRAHRISSQFSACALIEREINVVWLACRC